MDSCRGARRRQLLALVLLTALVGAATACQPVSAGPMVENFDGTSLNSALWYPNRWFASSCAAGATSDEQQWYRPNAATVSGGQLVLTATAASNYCSEGSWSGTKPYSSAWVQSGGSRSVDGSTAPGYTFTFGRIDVRFQASAGAGLWPAIWLLAPGSADISGKLAYPSRPEIDVVEIHGDTPSLWRFHLHSTTPTGDVDPGSEYDGANTSTGFHTASVEWRSDHITWFVDGVARWTYTGPGIPQEPMYLIMNLGVGGIAGPPSPAAFPATMRIESVQVSP